MREISSPGKASGTSGLRRASWRLRSRTLSAGMNSNSLRGAPMSSSIETLSAFAAFVSTASVGLAVPVSRLAQVGRGMPERPAICCCDMLCDSRKRRTLAARFCLIFCML